MVHNHRVGQEKQNKFSTRSKRRRGNLDDMIAARVEERKRRKE